MPAPRFVRLLVSALMAPVMAVVPGCSVFVPSHQDLTIVPSEDTAEVYVNGNRVGTGTQTVSVKRGEDYAVMAKSGERVATAKVGRTISGTGVADIVGGLFLLVPFIGVFSPGFWALNPDKVSLALPQHTGYIPAQTAAPYPVVVPSAPAAKPAPAVSQQPAGTTDSGSRLPPRRPAGQ